MRVHTCVRACPACKSNQTQDKTHSVTPATQRAAALFPLKTKKRPTKQTQHNTTKHNITQQQKTESEMRSTATRVSLFFPPKENENKKINSTHAAKTKKGTLVRYRKHLFRRNIQQQQQQQQEGRFCLSHTPTTPATNQGGEILFPPTNEMPVHMRYDMI